MRYTSTDLSRLPAELVARIATGEYNQAVVGACTTGMHGPSTTYSLAVLLYPSTAVQVPSRLENPRLGKFLSGGGSGRLHLEKIIEPIEVVE